MSEKEGGKPLGGQSTSTILVVVLMPDLEKEYNGLDSTLSCQRHLVLQAVLVHI